ncbi:hypothetical protein LTS18_007168, partial [Coniosporium uncinatum]
IFKRPVSRFKSKDTRDAGLQEEDEDEEEAYLPFANATTIGHGKTKAAVPDAERKRAVGNLSKQPSQPRSPALQLQSVQSAGIYSTAPSKTATEDTKGKSRQPPGPGHSRSVSVPQRPSPPRNPPPTADSSATSSASTSSTPALPQHDGPTRPSATPSRASHLSRTTTTTTSSSIAAPLSPASLSSTSAHRHLLSPDSQAQRRRRSAATKEGGGGGGSEGGTPSMGSSFSDLEMMNDSITQSALEDVLQSQLQRGSVASRVSLFGQALRSRYLPQDPQN